MPRSRHLILRCACVGLYAIVTGACSSNGTSGDNQGGLGGAATTGGSNSAVSSGGNTQAAATGGAAPASGGVTAATLGGSPSGGGVSSAGGTKSGGGASAAASGGASSITGGAKGTGGASSANTGGVKNTGGAPSSAAGGSSSVGGTKNTGGTVPSSTGGGTATTGGTKNTGGTTSATGGMKSTGGVPATGGAPATGGTKSSTGGSCAILSSLPTNCGTTNCDNATPVNPQITSCGALGNVTMYSTGPSKGGACIYQDTSIMYYAAINMHVVAGDNLGQWKGGTICGQCFEVTVVTNQGTKSVVVRITDKCPDGSCGIDLGGSAPAVVMGTSIGRYQGAWRPVSCAGHPEVSDGPPSLHVKDGSSGGWSAIQIRNPLMAVAGISYQDRSNGSISGNMGLAPGIENYYLVPTDALAAFSTIDITITYADGSKATVSLTSDQLGTANATYPLD